MQVKRNVVIKGIVTPWLRDDLRAKANALIKQTEIEMQTLERQMRQLSVMVPGENDAQKNMVRQQLQLELNDRETLIRQLKSDLANIDKLQDGEEVVYAVLEGFVDLQPGDVFEDKINKAEVIIKDGAVVELRNA
ncbi:YlqD family protein [Coprothermobacter platensis]|jgi:hypothetical protein|uniref:YlqD family protein n=1 Tax=Coprothermobacter platensis TaxID=108819 RepID=UPI00035E69C2|nr:YlqD family protein [Coprothermobacter platensis]